MTRKQIEKKYRCTCFKDSGFDNSSKFWVAYPNNVDDTDDLFEYADGWTLKELVENIKDNLYSNYQKQINDDYKAHLDIRN